MRIKLSRFQIANVKRTNKSVAITRKKCDKLKELIDSNMAALEALEREIEAWESPIVTTLGLTSQEILDTLDDEGYCGYEDVEEDTTTQLPTEAQTDDFFNNF